MGIKSILNKWKSKKNRVNINKKKKELFKNYFFKLFKGVI